jgi:cell division protein FtsL
MSSESSDKPVKIPSKKTDENTEASKKDELERLKLRLGFAKFAITLFFGTVLTSLLSFFINYKEVQITAKENELQLQLAEREELANYFRYTMEGDIYDRLKLSSFFGNVITDQGNRSYFV